MPEAYRNRLIAHWAEEADQHWRTWRDDQRNVRDIGMINALKTR